MKFELNDLLNEIETMQNEKPSFTNLPDGTYSAIIENMEVLEAETSDNKFYKYLNITYSAEAINEIGETYNRKVFDRLNLTIPDELPAKIAKQRFFAMFDDCRIAAYILADEQLVEFAEALQGAGFNEHSTFKDFLECYYAIASDEVLESFESNDDFLVATIDVLTGYFEGLEVSIDLKTSQSKKDPSKSYQNVRKVELNA